MSPSFLSSRHWAEAAARLIALSGLSPNALSLFGVGLSGGVAWLLANGQFFWGGWLLLGAGAFDTLDGALARVTGRASRFGAFLDSTLDRISEAVVFFGLLVFYAGLGSLQEILLIYLAMVGSLLVSYTRARAEGLGLECQVGLFPRPMRVLLLVGGLIINQVIVVLWVLAVFSHLTALQRVIHVWRQTGVSPPDEMRK